MRLYVLHKAPLMRFKVPRDVYRSGPVWGRVVDTQGPRIPLIGAFTLPLVGYSGINMYDDGIGDAATVSTVHFAVLGLCGFMTGLAGNSGLAVAANTIAKSFPDTSTHTPRAYLAAPLTARASLRTSVFRWEDSRGCDMLHLSILLSKKVHTTPSSTLGGGTQRLFEYAQISFALSDKPTTEFPTAP
ncbi:hypothetical protein PAXINDRAFT_102748 [Paxillus involutus ATCC 200175]|uniref:Uncharacterized protein n=1 Tax=Paxillus involutus ATCC 200175 TaxID=664439 RepID=A0A0C9TJ06_PAXIN|nr:hypothetical protein PAXINDRAFT_102748 [Paxillus involutus ATCC 200175]